MHVVTFLGNKESDLRFKAAFPAGTTFTTVPLKDTTAFTQLTVQFPTLESFLDSQAPEWTSPLILMSFSAGTWALRHYLKEPRARALARAVVIMDGLYGGVPCNLSKFPGVVAYAQEANASPNEKRFVLTYSHDNPQPPACSEAIGSGPGVVIAPEHETTHNAQLTRVGPDAVRRFVTPWLTAPRTPTRGRIVVVGGAVVVGFLLYRWLT